MIKVLKDIALRKRDSDGWYSCSCHGKIGRLETCVEYHDRGEDHYSYDETAGQLSDCYMHKVM